jgi:hypothetical protein
VDGLLWVRLVCVATFGLGAVAIALRFEQVCAALKKFFFEPQSALCLALTRICIFYLLFDFTLDCEPWHHAALPRKYLSLPPGWSFWGQYLPITVAGVRAVKWIAVLSCGLTVLGVATRLTAPLAALSSLYTLGIPNFYLSIGHGYHVPVLSGLILSLSPCGDALSFDSWLRRRRGEPEFEPSAAYTAPIRFCWLLLGTMYLFPGLWKLWEGGDHWISGEKLRAVLYVKWSQLPDFYPAFRIDKSPLLLSILGTGTLVLEIGFFFAMFNRVTRVVAGALAMFFHIGILLEMAIGFSWLHPLIVLFDPALLELGPLRPVARLGDRAAAWLRARLPLGGPREPRGAPPARSVGPAFVLGAACTAAMIIAGFGPLDSYPIAVYPRFSSPDLKFTTIGSVFEFALRPANGAERRLGQSHFSEAALFAILKEAKSDLKRHRRARFDHKMELLRNLASIEWGPFKPGDQLLIYRQDFTVDPDRREPKRDRPVSLIDAIDL